MTERVPECLTCRHWYRYRERIVGECTISPHPLSHRYRGQCEICDCGLYVFGEERKVEKGQQGRYDRHDYSLLPEVAR
jgi:hypothetical protein